MLRAELQPVVKTALPGIALIVFGLTTLSTSIRPSEASMLTKAWQLEALYMNGQPYGRLLELEMEALLHGLDDPALRSSLETEMLESQKTYADMLLRGSLHVHANGTYSSGFGNEQGAGIWHLPTQGKTLMITTQNGETRTLTIRKLDSQHLVLEEVQTQDMGMQTHMRFVFSAAH